MTKLKYNGVLCHVHSDFFSLVAKRGINILYSTESFCFSVTSWIDTMTLQRLILFTAAMRSGSQQNIQLKMWGFFQCSQQNQKLLALGNERKQTSMLIYHIFQQHNSRSSVFKLVSFFQEKTTFLLTVSFCVLAKCYCCFIITLNSSYILLVTLTKVLLL